MTDQKHTISTLLDGDYPVDDAQALNRVLGDVNQRDTLGRYRMIGDVLRHDLPRHIQTDFAAELRARIEQEAGHSSASAAPKTRATDNGVLSWLWKPMAGFALAAAVAVVTVTTLQPNLQTSSTVDVAAIDEASQARTEQLAATPVIQRDVRTVSTDPDRVARNDSMTWKIKRDEAALQSKLNRYLINHNEFSGSINGIIPQARVVGFDERPQ